MKICCICKIDKKKNEFCKNGKYYRNTCKKCWNMRLRSLYIPKPKIKQIAWNKGKKTPIETRIKQSKAAIGRKYSEAARKKMSESRTHNSISRQSWNFKEWKKKVFKRDNFLCVDCGNNNIKKLHSHHIFRFDDNIEHRFNIDNGVTLCASCHAKREGFQKGNIPWCTGKKMSAEYRAKLSKAHKGKKLSDKHKKNIGKSSIGHTPWNKGKKMSDEYRKNLSGRIPWNKGLRTGDSLGR